MFESAASSTNGGFGRGGGQAPLLLSMEAELEAWRGRIRRRAASGAAVIHRVPPSLRLDASSVEPAVVSIGPYHRGRPDLMAMEQIKWRSLDVILQLNRERKLGDYLREMAAMEPRARGCYAEDVGYVGSDEFAAMLLLDGCFLAVPFLGEQQRAVVPAAAEWFTPAVARDVLLLENQIPLFVVQRIVDLATPAPAAAGSDRRQPSCYSSPPSALLPKRVAETMKDLMGLHANMAMESAALQAHHHLLDLLHSMFFRPVFESEPATEVARGTSANSDKEKDLPDSGGAGLRTLLCLLPSAWELQDAGVKLRKRERRGLLDATFRDSAMQVPFLRVDRFTASLLRNLVAWEITHPGAGNGVTVYVLFMDRLVRTGRDVTVLAEKGIVEHRLGGDGEIPSLFDGIAAGLPLEIDVGVINCHLKPMLGRLRKYQKSNLNKWKAWIKREFSGNEEFYLGLLLQA